MQTTAKQAIQNGEVKERNRKNPKNELDIYDRAIRPTARDQYLKSVNLGLGNYHDKEYWQNVESFRKGLYADAAFGRRFLERSIKEVCVELGKRAWDSYLNGNFREKDIPDEVFIGDREEDGKPDRRRFIEIVGRQKWDSLGPNVEGMSFDERETAEKEKVEVQARYLEEIAGMDSIWIPPFWRMLEMRHESSRSRGGRLLDNLFGRRKEILATTPERAQEQVRRFENGGRK